jgi:hypothetical protein
MKKTPAILSLIFSLLFCVNANGQTGNEAVARLKSFLVSHIAEKAYLHFDKTYYAAGDTMYFKAYVTLGEKHELSNLSGVLHVELINTRNKVDQSIKLQITDGVAWGDFALPDSLPAGNYRVLAYTRWMRNDGNYFEKVIPIGSLQGKIPESGIHTKPVNEKADLQFFPEGGQLVAGISSKVAFKAVGVNGLGLDVRGVIVDNTGVEVSRFSSAHLGMGYFYLDPLPGKTYKAKVSFTDGSANTIGLPAASVSGIALSVDNDSIPKATVKIEASAAYFNENKGKSYSLLIYSGGVATTVNLKLDSATITLDVLKRKLHTGIATITLFSAVNEPLAERLLFIQNYDQLNLEVNSDKTIYAKRGKANITLKAIDRKGGPATGHFSVSVTDESKAPVDENSESTILTDLLLTSDLKGYVEQPNFYFNNINDKTNAALDLVMLTHGYRRFEWKKLLNDEYPPIAFQPEKGLEISGQVKNLFGKPITKGAITLVPAKGDPISGSVSDDKGMFRFSNLVFYDTTKFVLSAVNKKGRNSTKITYFIDKPAPLIAGNQSQNMQTISDNIMAAFVENDKLQQRELLNYSHAKGIMLKEVKVKATKSPKYPSRSYVAEFAADQVIHGKDILYGGPLALRLEGVIHRVHFVNGRGNRWVPVSDLGGPMLVIVDGAPGNLDDVSTDGVSTIEVLLPPNSYIYGSDGIGGVLVVTTKPRGSDPENMPSFGVLPITVMGFYKAREFYLPRYDNANTSWQRDLRSTIYWKPELQTDKDGKASFDFYNADGTGTYRVVIEGIDEKGNLGRQVYRYKVE